METCDLLEKKTPESEFFTPDELASYLKVSKKFIEKHLSTRRIPGAVKIGRVWRFRRADIQKRLLSGSLLLDSLN